MDIWENAEPAPNVMHWPHGRIGSNIIGNMTENGPNFLMYAVGLMRLLDVGPPCTLEEPRLSNERGAIIGRLPMHVKCAAWRNVSNGIIQITGCLF